MAEKVNRKGNGQFGQGGGPGRPQGCVNKTTIDFRRIKQQLAGSYDRVDGDAIFDKLAQEQPAVWCTLIVKCLPKERDVSFDIVDPSNQLNMRAAELEEDPIKDEVYHDLLKLASGGPITAKTVSIQLEMYRARRNGQKQLPG